MRRIDGHTHITPEPKLEIETNLTSYDLSELAQGYAERIKETDIEHAVAIPLDENLLRDEKSLKSLLDVRDSAGCFSLVFLVDPLADDAEDLVEKIDRIDGLGVKLHPYVQRTGTQDHFPRIRQFLEEVESRNLLTIIDCSYGGEHMYEVNGVRLGHAMAKTISSPIVLAHGGGRKIHEAYLTADVFQNIYLDTSFSITYWEGSSVTRDFAFAMKEMEMDRWIWGTDRPFAGHEESVMAAEKILTEHGLTEYAEQLFYENMRDLLDRR
jgi:predicted TIM-barrel fold metal-dependent hydrolase